MEQSRFVTAWEKKSGVKRQIPRHWLGTPLGEPFTMTEPKATPAAGDSNKAADAAAKGK